MLIIYNYIYIYVYNSTGLGHWSESMFHVQNGGRNTHPLRQQLRHHGPHRQGLPRPCAMPLLRSYLVMAWGLGLGIGPT